ncbi:MAG: tetratricopeptide repeat protein [Kiritimatiellia bacterium]
MKHARAPKTIRLLACALACAGGLAAPAPAAFSDPAQIQTEAYVNLVQADQSLDAGRLDEALAQYQAARDYYDQISREYPGHEPRIIQYRKTYCDNQVADILRRKDGGDADELSELAPQENAAAAGSPAPESTPADESPADRSAEIDYLKNRIAGLETDLAKAEAVQNDVESLSAANEQLKNDLGDAQRLLAEKTAGEQSALEGLRAELADKDRLIQDLQRDLEAKKQLDQALNDMEAKANDLRARNERLDREIKTLDAELDDAELRADQAEQKAKQSEQAARQAEDRAQKAERHLAAAQRKSKSEKTGREKAEAKSAPEPKPADTAKAETEPAFVPSPVAATVPPKPVPHGMSAADFARKLLQEGDNDSALATVQEARKSAPADMNLLLIEGISLIRLQRYPEAATLLIDLAKNHPQNAEAHATLGAAMMGAGFYEEARETLLIAAKLDKNLPECHYNLAQIYAFIDPVNLKLARRHYKLARDLGLAQDEQLEKALQ